MSNSSTSPDIAAQFIGRYRREFDFFEQAGRIVAQQLETQLESSGIRAMVTFRAKNPKRLEAKVRQRDAKKKYASVDDIFADIVDLAGVRVALYFPAERLEVDKIIRDRFAVAEERLFEGSENPAYKKRFSGYWATHYRLQLREAALTDANMRFAEAKVEVQVASVLMHAWSEVEHDLVYKPLQGTLSEDELAILDELNGMVLAGEIALERLQRAAEARLAKQGASFENHYDLASFLIKYVRMKDGNELMEPVVGDVQVLFRFLQLLNISTAEELEPYLENLVPDSELRPVAEQIADQIIASDPERYNAYAIARNQILPADLTLHMVDANTIRHDAHSAIGYFLSQWICLEKFLRDLASVRGVEKTKRGIMPPSVHVAEALGVFTDEQLRFIHYMRRVRNNLVHGVEVPEPKFVMSMAQELAAILNNLLLNDNADVRQAAQRALGGVAAAA
ncbi:GTP pyrophosphokinase [Ralstonia thomasii]|jgi:ppGpp synthetase/RelA/SpoT-type nucleotidyltranferase|uniref:RelA/SpoT domain-containing protein n=1 Tax=Ralstonia thomasii TaxID=3058596 RepID=A0ABM9IX12_9RALS|nr:RelA/SpoT domain-containing protein [Ralstonia sp. LMG 18095]CAJ0775104.1 hypothetical protein LMG18095_00004 [Ralstonia sp. LMG 18095]